MIIWEGAMTASEVEKWEAYYRESVQKDFARRVYKECDREDQEATSLQKTEDH